MKSSLVKKAIAGVSAVAMLTGLAACGGGSSADDANSLTIYSYFNKNELGGVVDAFKKANPDINIEISYSTDPNEYGSTLQTRMSGNQTPDIFNLYGGNQYEIMDNKLALDITGEDFLDGIDDSAFRTYSRDGKVYGMPLTSWATGILYNKDLLKKAGYDAVPEDLDEFIEMGKKLESQGVTPYLEQVAEISGMFNTLLASYQAANGNEGLEDKVASGESTYEKEWTKPLEAYQKVIDAGVLPQQTVGLKSDQIVQSFVNGETAMIRSGAWDIATVKEAGIDFGYAPFPAYPGSEAFIGGGPNVAFAMSASISDAKKPAAKKFMQFLNSEEGLKLFSESTGAPSLSANYTSEIDPAIESLFTDYVNTGKVFWIDFQKGTTAMLNELATQQQNLVNKQTTPQDFAKAMDTRWASVEG